MKLVDILARDLKKWPEGLEVLSQLRHNGAIINGKGYDARDFDRLEIAEDTYPGGVLVTRAQWQAAVDALKTENNQEKLMNIDWSKAPEGATHFSPAFKDFIDLWAKKEGDQWMYRANGEKIWHHGPGPSQGERYISRPIEWNGEGLPPVGTVCEFNDGCGGGYKKVEIMYVSAQTILVKFDGSPNEDVEGAYSPHESLYFRPIRTAEQIAAEARMACAKEFHDLVYPECKWHKLEEEGREAWALIYDAGYRKQVQK